MKSLLTNGAYMTIVVTIGGAVGFFNTVLTLIQQFMCSRAYEITFSGLCGSLLLGTGLLGAVGAAVIVAKTKRLTETAKIMVGLAALDGIVIVMLLRMPGMEVPLAIACAM